MEQAVFFTSNWNYRSLLNTNLQNFTGWSGDSGLFPPNVEKGDNFTSNYRPMLNNTLYDFAIDGINVYGYPGENSQENPQPFPAENIVILTDGMSLHLTALELFLLFQRCRVLIHICRIMRFCLLNPH